GGGRLRTPGDLGERGVGALRAGVCGGVLGRHARARRPIAAERRRREQKDEGFAALRIRAERLPHGADGGHGRGLHRPRPRGPAGAWIAIIVPSWSPRRWSYCRPSRLSWTRPLDRAHTPRTSWKPACPPSSA